MEISSGAAAQIGSAVQVAIQKQLLDSMKAQGASVSKMIDSAPTPAGSVNTSSQGRFVDALA